MNPMGKVRTYRADDETAQRISELLDITGVKNESDLVRRCVCVAHTLVNLSKKNEPINIHTLVEYTMLYSYTSSIYTTSYNSKKHEKKTSESSFPTGIYQQDINKYIQMFGGDFADQWTVWKDYRRQKKMNNYVSSEECAALKKLFIEVKGDTDKAIKAIHEAMASGWKTIHYHEQRITDNKRGGFTGVDPEEFGTSTEELFRYYNPPSASSGNAGSDSEEG